MKTALVVLLVLMAVIVGAVFIAAPQLGDKVSFLKSEPKRTEVRIDDVRQGRLTETVSAPGEIEPHTKVDISAEVSARIEQLPFREGEEVRRGDLIVKLDDRDLKAALASAQARRDGERFRLQSDQARKVGLESNLDFARRDLKRKEQLFETGDISQGELDTALERVRDLEASLQATIHSISVVESSLAAAEADIARAEKGLDNTVIVAPIDGVITALNAEVGEVVLLGTMNNPGTVIMTIADLSRMILNAQVAETDIARVADGQGARIYINAYPDDVFTGSVRRIALQRSGAPDGTGFFKTEVEIDLQGRRILSGLIANVDIEIETHEGLVVPRQSVVERKIDDMPEDARDTALVDKSKTTTFVAYRVVDDKTVCTPVKTGPSDLTHTLITEGLAEGDRVVSGPYKVLEALKHDELVKDLEKPDEPDEDTAAGELAGASDTADGA